MTSQLATRRSRLCIEGFPRSGNSFAMTCLLEIPGLTRDQIAHHTHNVANVRRALSLGLPTYVLLRDPLAACQSLSVMGVASVEEGLRAWLAFYGPLAHRADQVALIPMETLSTDPFGLIEAAACAVDAHLPPERANFVSYLLERRRTADRAWGQPSSHGSVHDPERSRAKVALSLVELDRGGRRDLEKARELRNNLLSRSSVISARTLLEETSSAA